MAYYPLPAYNIGNALNFEPVNNALAGVVQQNNANRNYGLQQQQLGLEKQRTDAAVQTANIENEGRFAQLTGGVAQSALGLKDPNARSHVWQGILASHPNFRSNLIAHGMDPNDADAGLTFIADEARGYQNPIDVAMKKAQTANIQSETATRGQQLDLMRRNLELGSRFLDQGQGGTTPAQPMKTPDGKTWAIGPDGNYHEVE